MARPRRRLGVAAACLLLAACSGGDDVGEAGLPAEPFSLGLEVGDCFDRIVSPDVADVPAVPCDQPHDLEVYARVDLPEGPYPGDDGVATTATTRCTEEFAAYVGGPQEGSGLLALPLAPTRAQWDEGDRALVCAVGLVEGRLEESVQGTEAAPPSG